MLLAFKLSKFRVQLLIKHQVWMVVLHRMHAISLLFLHFNSFALFSIRFQDVNISILAQSIHIHCIPAVFCLRVITAKLAIRMHLNCLSGWRHLAEAKSSLMSNLKLSSPR